MPAACRPTCGVHSAELEPAVIALRVTRRPGATEPDATGWHPGLIQGLKHLVKAAGGGPGTDGDVQLLGPGGAPLLMSEMSDSRDCDRDVDPAGGRSPGRPATAQSEAAEVAPGAVEQETEDGGQ